MMMRARSLLIKPMTNFPVKIKQINYEDFKRIVKEELTNEPKGLTWTDIRHKRPELYQKVPNNLWVKLIETDIGLVREKVGTKTIWKLK